MLLVAPLTVLPWSLGLALWITVLSAGFALALWALGVRDLRCYAVAFISAPVFGDLMTGNATLLLVPLVALAWRWRDRWLRCGVATGLAISSKFLVWPLVFWLLGTRRYRAAGAALAATALALLVPWAVIGFDGMTAYPDLLRLASEIYGVRSYSVSTMASALGVGTELALRLAFATGLAIAVLAFVVGRRGLDEASVALAVLAAILGSPIVWEYNYALLFVPIAILRPRFSAAVGGSVARLLDTQAPTAPTALERARARRERVLSPGRRPARRVGLQSRSARSVAGSRQCGDRRRGRRSSSRCIPSVLAREPERESGLRRRGQEPDDDLVAARVLLESVTPDAGTVHAGWLGAAG